ncbi:MAG TPA: DUF4142 domain-containing protein [Terracidiphilus sp.]|nr:DUF4142 domain-containing protein [Terracidiphilus sp.]
MHPFTGKKILTLSAATLFAGAMALAQQQPGGSGSQSPNNQPPTATTPGEPGYPGSGVPGSGVPGAQQSMSRSFEDQEFLRDAFQGSAIQAQMSELAEEKSPSPDVKQYGAHMVQIHNELDTQLKPIADQLGVKENQKLSKKEKQKVEQLNALSGPDFDRTYIQEMAMQQKHAVKQFKTEADAGQTPAIKQAARMDEPIFSQHLKVLEQIAQSHNVTIAQK